MIAEAGLIALFHSGTTGIGAGMPGGGGVRLKYSNPMAVDDVAADFPELDIILAHPSFPWQDEALAIAVHKPNVYIDLSGWSPKYFPENLIRYTNSQLRHKMLFGSDYPLITPDRWLSDFAKLPIKDEVRPLVLKENAARWLRWASGRSRSDRLQPGRQAVHRAEHPFEHDLAVALGHVGEHLLLDRRDRGVGDLEQLAALGGQRRRAGSGRAGGRPRAPEAAALEPRQDLDHRLGSDQRPAGQLGVGQSGARAAAPTAPCIPGRSGRISASRVRISRRIPWFTRPTT